MGLRSAWVVRHDGAVLQAVLQAVLTGGVDRRCYRRCYRQGTGSAAEYIRARTANLVSICSRSTT